MSRCFPYTSRGYVRKGVNGEAALIESIKLQNATEKSKTGRRKEKKTHKTERKKEERSKSSYPGDVKAKTPSEKKVHEQRQSGSKRKHSEKGDEQVERSDLTAECGRPLFFQNLGYISDSTQSSDKRRKNGNSSLNHGDRPQNGTVIRIRLNQKPVENLSRLAPKKLEMDLPSLETGNGNISAPDNRLSTSSMNRSSSSNEGLELLYKNLIDNWKPAPLQLAADHFDDDSDWLCGTIHRERPSKNPNLNRRNATIDDQTCRGWPQARYLPEIGIYALPYSIPY